MSPKKRRKKGRPAPHRAAAGHVPPQQADGGEPDLVRDVRRMLRQPHPWQLLSLVSGILAAVDPRQADPFARAQGLAPPSPDLQQLAQSFLEVDLPETTALLTVLAEMVPDEVLTRRIRREVAGRGHRMPRWLTPLGPITVERAVEMVHVLGDGDNIALAMRTAAGDELTVVAYIDHNVGTLVKDAFVVREAIDRVLKSFHRAAASEPDLHIRPVALADARARITEAIETAAMTYPPFETETWPASRPLVEWVLRGLPEGGAGYVRPEWSEADRVELAQRFFDSPFGHHHDEEDRQLFDSILWFACDYGPGDPLRWSPVAVEILLTDWLPRKVVADPEFLRRAPDVLRSYIRFCHAERGIRAALTDETLAAIDSHEPEYQRAIRSARPQGPAALLAAMGVLDPDSEGGWFPDGEPLRSYRDVMLATLREAVGGIAELEELDTDPLPDESLELGAVAADVRQRVRDVATLTDRCCNELFDVECRTACRRLLADVAGADPDIFRRRGRSDTAAAALTWIVAKANDLLGSHRGGVTAGELAAWFGVSGSASQRAHTMLRALGRDDQHGAATLRLGTPRYLVSSRRRELIETRQRLESG